MKLLLPFVLFVFTALASFAQSPAPVAMPRGNAKISGTVLDAASKKPVEYAIIALVEKTSGKTVDGTMTDDKGQFTLQKVAVGSYRVNISFLGYQAKVLDNITVEADNSQLNLETVALSPDAKKLDEVLVVGEKPLVEEKVDRLVYNADKDISTKGGTAADVLRNVPMLTVDPDGNVQLRGSSNIRVLINGKPSSIMAGTIADAVRQIPADIIKSVEVITSPSAKYDAEGTAGIINIITKKNTLEGVTGNFNINTGNVSTIGGGTVNFRRQNFGINANVFTNQFYNRGRNKLERYDRTTGNIYLQDGSTKNRSGFIGTTLGFDYDFSEKSSLTGSVFVQPSHSNVDNPQEALTITPEGQKRNRTLTNVVNRNSQLAYDINLGYLKTFAKPQQEFSLLALYSQLNADNLSNQDQFTPGQELTFVQRNANDSKNRELTFQTDYVHPFAQNQQLEMGGKGIFRYASSDVDYHEQDYLFPDRSIDSKNIFSYYQNVYAGYATYGFQVKKKLNVKLGSRYEFTDINADYKTRSQTFNTDYHTYIPSVNLSYTLKEGHTFKASFTQRIQRPQLLFLNPYREVQAPKLVQIGNPELKPELTDLYEISYGTYKGPTSINFSLYTRFTDNAIEVKSELVQDTTYVTFLNVAKNQVYGLSAYGATKLFKTWSISTNANLYYRELEGLSLSNQGWMYNVLVSTSYGFGKGWLTRFNGSFNSRIVQLQGRRAAFFYHNLTLRKEVLNKRGGIGINLANPFMRGTRMVTDFETDSFTQRIDNITYTRGIRFSLEYRFGQLKQAAPRKRRNINNDDALRSQ